MIVYMTKQPHIIMEYVVMFKSASVAAVTVINISVLFARKLTTVEEINSNNTSMLVNK